MDAARAPSVRVDRLSGAVAFAHRAPGKALAFILGLHLLLWTIVPILVCRNLQLDLVEGLALGKEWQLGYWKHPPLPWWVSELAYRLTGHVDVVYVLEPLAVVLCFYAVWLLARETIGGFEGLIAVFCLEGMHYYNFSAVKFSHDILQLPFWAFTGLFFHRALRRGGALDGIAGVFLAGAFWSKYAALALAVTLLLFLVVDPAARRAWRTPGPFLMAAAFLLVIAPNVWWLFGHDFLPLRYVDERSRVATDLDQYLTFSTEWIGGQILFIFPAAVLLGVLYFGAGAARNRSVTDEAAFDRRYVTWLALGPFLFATLIAALLRREVQGLWGFPLWSFAPLAVLIWFPIVNARNLSRFAAAFIAVFVAMPVIYAAAEVGEPFLRDRAKATQFDGKLLADTVTRAWRERYHTPLVYVGGAEFPANTVAVYSSDRPHVVVHGEPKLSPWIDPADLRRRGAVLLWEWGSAPNNIENLDATFGAIEIQPDLLLPRLTWHHPVRPDRVHYAFVPPRP